MIDSLPAPPLSITRLRFTFSALEPMTLPRWKGALLRGGLGYALKRSLCDVSCQTHTSHCPRAFLCPYQTIFAPDADGTPSSLNGLRDAPRPYAICPPLDDQRVYRPGDQLVFDLVLVGQALDYLPHLIFAFETLGQMGLGKDHGKARLLQVDTNDPLRDVRHPLVREGVLHNDLVKVRGSQIVEFAGQLAPTLTLHFRTPTRLKHHNHFITIPDCHVLVRAALRRISQLCAFYGDGAWEIPFADYIHLAESVLTRASHTTWVDWSRTSSHTHHHMTLGGFVGSMTYQDVPASIRAILLLGSLVHIGKAVVFGHGSYTLSAADAINIPAMNGVT